nr:hypothetical protein [Tanacetum cinerariifolium]
MKSSSNMLKSIIPNILLENTKILKEQNEQLLKDLRTSKINSITYKTGLESVEARLLVYKKNESVYEEDIKILKQEFVNEPVVKKLAVETSEAKARANKPKVYALTVNPIVYTSCIEQFWATIKAKTINEEGQSQALVDGKKILITESTVKRDLQLEDAEGTSLGGDLRCLQTMGGTVAQTRSERVSKISNDPLLSGVNTPQSGEDSLKLNELMELCTKLQQRVLDLETTKTTQALEIKSLKRIVKKLKRKKRSRTHRLKRLYKVGLSARVESSEDEVNVHNDEDMFGVNDLDGDEVIVESVDVAEQAKEVVDDITLAKALMEIKSVKSKALKFVIQEPEQVSSQQSSQVKDKGKGKMVEPEPVKKLLKNDQLMLDKEIAFKLQAKEKEEERIAKERAQQIKEVNIAWNDIQAKIDADYELAQRLQAEEQEELTDAEKKKLFMQFLEKRRKFFTCKRAKEKRDKPPTRAQQRSIMYTYLKNIKGWKLKSLKNKSFDKIQELFDKAMIRLNTFVDYRTELVLDSLKKAKAEVTEGSLKRAREELKQEIAKKHNMEDDKESVKLKQRLEIIPDDGDDVTIDATPLSFKSPTIVDYKSPTIIEKIGKFFGDWLKLNLRR